MLRIWNWQQLENLLSAQGYWLCIPVSTKANRFPPWYMPNTSWTLWWGVKHRTSKKYTASMVSWNKKKTNQNLSESDSENEVVDFPRFIVIESLEEVSLAKFLPFLKEKVISAWATLKNVKKTRSSNLLVEVESWRLVESLSKMKNFHPTKCAAYPCEKLNTCKGVIRSQELALATEEKITSALGILEVINIRRISIRKGGEERIQTNTYILTFN